MFQERSFFETNRVLPYYVSKQLNIFRIENSRDSRKDCEKPPADLKVVMPPGSTSFDTGVTQHAMFLVSDFLLFAALGTKSGEASITATKSGPHGCFTV